MDGARSAGPAIQDNWFECTNCGYVGWGTKFETDEERAAEKIREEQPYIRKVSQH